MQIRDDLPYWIGFQRIPGVGSGAMLELKHRFGSLRAAWEADVDQLVSAGVSERVSTQICAKRNQVDLARELELIERHDLQVITFDDPAYPRLLREINHPPALLYVRGELRPEDDVSIGMVGTRRATTYGLDMANRIATELARSSVTIVSGLALGIDAAAHRAALEAGGRTIAVCGCGLDTVYPPKNRRLAHQIAEHGAMISEYPIGTRPDAKNFPARNRSISGIVRGVVVVEAPRKSGALITASFAADQG
ncbi:MAG: DNA-processing protein DprA, partial [Chloroflexota bacterium]